MLTCSQEWDVISYIHKYILNARLRNCDFLKTKGKHGTVACFFFCFGAFSQSSLVVRQLLQPQGQGVVQLSICPRDAGHGNLLEHIWARWKSPSRQLGWVTTGNGGMEMEDRAAQPCCGLAWARMCRKLSYLVCPLPGAWTWACIGAVRMSDEFGFECRFGSGCNIQCQCKLTSWNLCCMGLDFVSSEGKWTLQLCLQ